MAFNIVVYSSVLFQPGGQVRNWANRVERKFTAAAISAAPINKRGNKGRSPYPVGALKASISGGVAGGGGSNILVTTISVDVPYAMFVLFGTVGPITGNGRKGLMALPTTAYGAGPRSVVSGQSPNNFLAVAGMVVAASEPSVRVGFGTPFSGMQTNMFRRF